jgi:hypothetical protein
MKILYKLYTYLGTFSKNKNSPNSNKIGIIPILLILILVFIILNFFDNKYPTKTLSTFQKDVQVNKQVGRFNLTKCLGITLSPNATFNVPTNGDNWSIDYNNGKIVYYKLISFNKENMLCGIKAVDSFGDDCEICIYPDGDKAIITFKYGTKTITYNGYAN